MGNSSSSPLTEYQKQSLAIIPKCTGFLSLVGSIYILQDILGNKTKRSKSTYHRILLGLSTFDCISSIVNILSTWPSPSSLDHVYLAFGTTATCTIQGFFNELSNVTTPLYTASLTLRVCLVILKDWKESQIQKYEYLFHIIPVSVGIIMSICGIIFKLYNNSGWLCWYATPSLPTDIDMEENEYNKIVRLVGMFRWIHYGIVWSAILSVSVGFYLIYRKVKSIEAKSPPTFHNHNSFMMYSDSALAASTGTIAGTAGDGTSAPGKTAAAVQESSSRSGGGSSQRSDSSFQYVLDTTTAHDDYEVDDDGDGDDDGEVVIAAASNANATAKKENAAVHHMTMESSEFVDDLMLTEIERERLFSGGAGGSSKFSLGDLSSENTDEDDYKSEAFRALIAQVTAARSNIRTGGGGGPIKGGGGGTAIITTDADDSNNGKTTATTTTSSSNSSSNKNRKEYYRNVKRINQLLRKQNRKGRRSYQVAIQSILYICALYATWTFTTVSWPPFQIPLCSFVYRWFLAHF